MKYYACVRPNASGWAKLHSRRNETDFMQGFMEAKEDQLSSYKTRQA